jgi:hypothetical protein
MLGNIPKLTGDRVERSFPIEAAEIRDDPI